MPKNATPKPKPDDQEQSKRFVQTAQELEADENSHAFERAFGLIAKPPPATTSIVESKDTEIKKR